MPGRILTLVCNLFLYLAVAGVAAMILAQVYEIVARYFFAAPTSWANELVSIALTLSVFLAMPKVAEEGGHVAILLLQDKLPERAAQGLAAAILVFAALTSMAVAGIATSVAMKQFSSGIMTIGNHPIPKSILTAVIALGFGLTGLQYLSKVFSHRKTVGAP